MRFKKEIFLRMCDLEDRVLELEDRVLELELDKRSEDENKK